MRNRLVSIAVGLLVWLVAGGIAMADALEDIRQAGKVRVGVCLASEPAGFRDGDGRPRGYDVDVARLLAGQLGVQLELIEVTVPTRMHYLESGVIDILACNLTATTARALQFDFSMPYLRTGIKMLVQRDSGITGFSALSPRRKVVVARGTTADSLLRARAPEAQAVYVSSAAEASLVMQQGLADAYLQDSLMIDYLALAFPGRVEALPETYSFDAICFGIQKGSPQLLRWLDLFASIYVSSGAYQTTYARWWGGEPPPLTPIW